MSWQYYYDYYRNQGLADQQARERADFFAKVEQIEQEVTTPTGSVQTIIKGKSSLFQIFNIFMETFKVSSDPVLPQTEIIKAGQTLAQEKFAEIPADSTYKNDANLKKLEIEAINRYNLYANWKLFTLSSLISYIIVFHPEVLVSLIQGSFNLLNLAKTLMGTFTSGGTVG